MRRFAVALLLVAGAFAGAADAQTRYVIVNGQRLNDAQVAFLDRVQCTRIPNGKYWLNTMTGAWGYANSPFTQGYLGALCNGGGGSQQRHRSLSERGLLYTPGDLNFR